MFVFNLKGEFSTLNRSSCFPSKTYVFNLSFILQSRSIILEIVKLLSSQAGFSICFTPMEGNGIADHLAAEAHKEVNPIGWVHTPSPLLSHLLALDVKRLNKLPRSAYDSTSQWVQDMRGVLLPSSPSSHCSGIG